MAPKNLFRLLDPTLHFLLGSLVSILFVEADDEAKTLAFKLPTAEEVGQYSLKPACVLKPKL